MVFSYFPDLSQPLSGFDKVWNSFSDLRSMTPLSVIFTQEEQPEIAAKKEKDLNQLGLHSQADLDLIFSHINSYPRKERYGKSPIEEFTFYYPESEAILSALHI